MFYFVYILVKMHVLQLLVLFGIIWQNIEARCKLGISGQKLKYNVIGLYSMFSKGTSLEFDENAVRLHLKLRYILLFLFVNVSGLNQDSTEYILCCLIYTYSKL